MSNPTKQGVIAEPFCSLFGHNLTLKSDNTSKKDIKICKICKEEFIANDFNTYSGLPKKSTSYSLFRSFLRRIERNDNRLISLEDLL